MMILEGFREIKEAYYFNSYCSNSDKIGGNNMKFMGANELREALFKVF